MIVVIGNHDSCGRCGEAHPGNSHICDVHGRVGGGCCELTCRPEEWHKEERLEPCVTWYHESAQRVSFHLVRLANVFLDPYYAAEDAASAAYKVADAELRESKRLLRVSRRRYVVRTEGPYMPTAKEGHAPADDWVTPICEYDDGSDAAKEAVLTAVEVREQRTAKLRETLLATNAARQTHGLPAWGVSAQWTFQPWQWR